MTAPMIQLPMLRPEQVHEVPGGLGGAGQALEGIGQMLAVRQAMQQQQEARMQQLAVLKGHLALEQEKFDAETKQRNEMKKQRETLSQQISAAFNPQAMQTPGGVAGAMGQSLGPLTGAGFGGEAAGMARDIPGLMQQQRVTATQTALGKVYQELQGKDLRDPRVQAEALSHLAAIDPDHANRFAESLRGLNGRYVFHLGNDGAFYIGDQTTGTVRKGPDTGQKGALSQPQVLTGADLALRSLRDAQALLAKDPTADIMPAKAAGAEGVGKAPWARTLLGLGAQIGIGPGTPEAMAAQNMTANQNNFRRLIANAVHSYMPVLMRGGGGGRSALMYDRIYNAVAPTAGQEDADIRNDAARIRGNMMTKLAQIASGKTGNMTELPFFNEAMLQGFTPLGGEQQQAGTTGGQEPLGLNDLLQGVPSK